MIEELNQLKADVDKIVDKLPQAFALHRRRVVCIVERLVERIDELDTNLATEIERLEERARCKRNDLAIVCAKQRTTIDTKARKARAQAADAADRARSTLDTDLRHHIDELDASTNQTVQHLDQRLTGEIAALKATVEHIHEQH